VSAQQPAPARPADTTWWGVPRLLWALTLVLSVCVAAVIVFLVAGRGSGTAGATASGQAILSSQGGPSAVWGAGQKAAPRFALADEHGRPISLARFHGRPVILTFIDPLCTTFCPIEAKVLDRMLARLPAAQRPAIVSVSVNRLGDNARAYRHDARAWRLTGAWHWAVGSQPALERVWKDYSIGVSVDSKTKDVTHTEAAYLVDRNGYQRALYLWPFNANDLVRGLRSLNG
jgi:cytochrome oxidase Cu insertion factor (SCO1/SenC/PrrC family)